MQKLLIDTGPLVAWFDRSDADHEAVAAFMDSLYPAATAAGASDTRLLTTWPVLTEVCHLLPERLVPAFMRWVAGGGVEVVDMPQAVAGVLAVRMDKYLDLPMDLADASLLWLCEQSGVHDILTLDKRDFGVYRTERGLRLNNLLEAGPKMRSANVRKRSPRE